MLQNERYDTTLVLYNKYKTAGHPGNIRDMDICRYAALFIHRRISRPEGGLDKIGEAIAYVFIWRLFIYGLPILVSGVSFCLWLYQNHRKAVIWLLLAIAVCIVFAVAYRIWGRKLVETPERTAARIDTFEKWEQKMRRYGFPEDRTGSDRTRPYM